jgi:SAM-dependent methyltransferase
MLELGNQYLYVGHKPFPQYPDKFVNSTMRHGVVAKLYWEQAGYRHVSLDVNGQDGALAYDLCLPFNLGEQFDVITDFGTSEHVSDLYACLENVWRHCKPGGLLMHANPKPGNWPGHGNWYRDEDFYRALVQVQPGTELVEVRAAPSLGNTTEGWLTYAVVRKNAAVPWMDRAAFAGLPVSSK